jgi:hypothetical protein
VAVALSQGTFVSDAQHDAARLRSLALQSK